MGSKKGHISQAGIAAIRKASKGRKYGRLKPGAKQFLPSRPGQGAGIVTVYDGSGRVTGTIDPWSREFTPQVEERGEI